MRLERLDYYMSIAVLTALRGTCSRLKVGCVLVDSKTKRILSVGYNSSVSKEPHCDDIGCLISNGHCVRCPHAEVAALLNMQYRPDKISCYLTHQPCYNCYKTLLAAGVRKIYYIFPYEDEDRDVLYNEVNNRCRMIKIVKQHDLKLTEQILNIYRENIG